MDILAEFISQMCIESPGARTSIKDLYTAYCNWCEENKETPIGKLSFSRRLEERGYKSVRIGHKWERGWQGIGIKSNQEEITEVF